MKNNANLTASELINMIAMNLREMNGMDVSNRNLSNAINRTKATAMGAQAALKLAIHDAKKNTGALADKKVLAIKQKTQKGKVKLLK